MRVYRVEMESGEGVYTGGAMLGFTGDMGNRADRSQAEIEAAHPGPEDDERLSAWWEGPWKNWSSKKADWHYRGRTKFFCGFRDEAQMLEWFDAPGMARMSQRDAEMLQRAQERGRPHSSMVVSTYEVHGRNVRKGARQVMFRRDLAKLVQRVPLSHYAGEAPEDQHPA